MTSDSVRESALTFFLLPVSVVFFFFFFFQAEDGIRDVAVTGVQTCALPICNGDPILLILNGHHYAEAVRTVCFGDRDEPKARQVRENGASHLSYFSHNEFPEA